MLMNKRFMHMKIYMDRIACICVKEESWWNLYVNDKPNKKKNRKGRVIFCAFCKKQITDW